MSDDLGLDRSVHDFHFTRRWFLNRNCATFREYVYPRWAGTPATYLELGVFEGMSMTWMMQRVLTHPESRAVGVDPWLMTRKLDSDFMDAVRKRARHNTRIYSPRCELIRGSSAEVLRRMVGKDGYAGIKRDSVDVCMVDGNHNALAVLDDALLVLQLVRPGGWILFDDVENKIEKADHVKHGVAMFVEEAGDKIKQIWKHKYMEAYEVQ